MLKYYVINSCVQFIIIRIEADIKKYLIKKKEYNIFEIK